MTQRPVQPALAVSVDDALRHASGLKEVADCFSDCAIITLAAEVNRLRAAPVALMDTRAALSVCALKEEDFPALYALQGHRVALVDLGPNAKLGVRPEGGESP